jgi:hypothetical protein
MKLTAKEKILKEYFVDRAKKAGKACLKKHGSEYYSMIGKKGGAIRGEQLRKTPVDNSSLGAIDTAKTV